MPPGNGHPEKRPEDSRVYTCAPVFLPPSYYFMYLLYFLPSSCHCWKPFPPCPVPSSSPQALFGVEARVLVSRDHAQPHAPSGSSSPWLRVTALLWLSLIPLIFDKALSSFLQGQAAWGPCRQPACGCLSPVSISGSLSTELSEVAGPLHSIPEQTLWPGRAQESSP